MANAYLRGLEPPDTVGKANNQILPPGLKMRKRAMLESIADGFLVLVVWRHQKQVSIKVQRLGQLFNNVEAGTVDTSFESADIGSIQLSLISKIFLRHALEQTSRLQISGK